MTIELWQVPLIVMAVIVAGYFAYVGIAGRSSDTVRLWIKMTALVALGVVVLAVGYKLLTTTDPTVLTTMLTLVMLAVEGFIAWIAWKQLKASQGQDSDRA
jgi:hypothetical protein